jgi:hypothetical protein
MSNRKPQRIKPIGRRRRLGNGLEAEVFPGPRLGPGVSTADFATIMSALERFEPDMPWKKARSQVLPMMPRVRPLPGGGIDLARMMLPPGILVGFGIDIGPAITFVTAPLLDRWRIDVHDLAGAALANLRQIVAGCRPDVVVRDQIAEVPVTVVQTRVGVAASLLLVPEALERFLGAGPALLIAPMRDILLALPADVDRDFAAWLSGEWEALDPNHLHLGGFRYERAVVVPEPLDQEFAQA